MRNSKSYNNTKSTKNNRKSYQNYTNPNYYNNTSEAFNYAPEYDLDNNPTRKRKIKKKIIEKYVKAEQRESYLSLKFFIGVAIFTIMGVYAVGISAKTIEKRFEIDSLNAELRQLKESTKNLETEIAKNLDLNYVEEYATTKLKMQKPASHQIVHINVPKESYTIKTNKTIDEEGFFKKFNFFDIFK